MRLSDGSIVSDISGICQSWPDYYSSIFSAGSVVLEGLLEHLIARLPADACFFCEGTLLVHEVRSASGGMAQGKSSGSGGLPMELCFTFCDINGSNLLTVLNDSLN